MRSVRFGSLLAMILTSTFAGTGMADDAKDSVRQAASASNRFGFDLYHQLAASQKGNLFLSPYSIETALTMTHGGARGTTAQQMAQVLHLDLPANHLHESFSALTSGLNESGNVGERKAFELVIANAIWAQKGHDFNPEYLNLIKTNYQATMEPVDFASVQACEASRKTINAWVEKQTHDKIKDLLPVGSVNELTRMVLTNAIYFKSSWETKFSQNLTKEETFRLAANSTATVSMMHQSKHRRYMDNDAVQAVELPYMYDRLSMVVLLPRKADGLTELEKSLDAAHLDGWLNALTVRDVELSFPKFQITAQFGLAPVLTKMGMVDAFSSKADFSGMSSGDPLAISDVIHKAFVDVNEDGTEAAAATAVTMMALSARMDPIEKAVFRADHPFLFLIRENKTGAILFLGRITNPKP